MSRDRGGLRTALVGVMVVVALAACSSGSRTQSGAADPGSVTRPETGPPSPPRALVCGPTIRREIAASIGMEPTTVSGPARAGGLVSCTYVYPGATMTLSLDERAGTGAASARFSDLARRLGARPEPPLLGDAAFISTDGSTLVVRGGSRILTVDLSGSPVELGKPPQARYLVARAVGGTIVGCDDPPCPRGTPLFSDESGS